MNKSQNKADFLVEIQTEELPPKALQKLSASFVAELTERLNKAELSYSAYQCFATPRRLGLLISSLDDKQPDKWVDRKGPAYSAAFDADGKPTGACIGFARSCGVTPDKLLTIENPQGKWVGFQQMVSGKKVTQLLPDIVKEALANLPIPKRMRWGIGTAEFVRPVHAVVMLYGDQVIETEILGCKSGRETRGHRFLCSKTLTIESPEQYERILIEQGFVIPDFNKRKEKIRSESLKLNPLVVMDEELLDEVTALVEWPVAIQGHFDPKFLKVPQEALISAMQDHQRYFPVLDKDGKLLPNFITISNIESQNVAQVISGNERVLRARLSDAAFFFEVDKKTNLTARLDLLKQIVFQAKLGTLHDKALRLATMMELLANDMHLNPEQAKQAGLLAKTDQTSQLVSEFPELQGVAGYYYAVESGESLNIADAIRDQYYPRFAGDDLPKTELGCALALSDRLDTLVGIFSINQQPTSEKDPFGLRRAALGVLRILIEKNLNLDLRKLIQMARSNYPSNLENKNVVDDVLQFILERLRSFSQEQGISADVFAAVAALNVTIPLDFHRRTQAVQAFKQMHEAESLSIANKRVSNILSQYNQTLELKDIDEKLFEHDSEKELAIKLREQQKALSLLSRPANYQEVLAHLAGLREPVDNFFDHVMVMTDDPLKRDNRILLLKKLRELFLNVADIALLQ